MNTLEVIKNDVSTHGVEAIFAFGDEDTSTHGFYVGGKENKLTKYTFNEAKELSSSDYDTEIEFPDLIYNSTLLSPNKFVMFVESGINAYKVEETCVEDELILKKVDSYNQNLVHLSG